MSRGPVILISGKHPTREEGGQGHSSYVRAHAYAALRAGFDPHVFCVGPSEAREEAAFGTIHQVRSSRPFRQSNIGMHAGRLAKEIARVVRDLNGPAPALLHAFGVWSYAGVLAQRRLRSQHIDAVLIGSSYTTHFVEQSAMLAGTQRSKNWGAYISFGLARVWSGGVVTGFERIGYRGCRFVMVNYRCIATTIEAAHNGTRIRQSRYSSEKAFAPATTEHVVYPRRDCAPQMLRIVAISTHTARKGVDVLIRSLARLRDRHVAFQATLVGGGPLLENHRSLVRSLGLERCVTVSGNVESIDPYLAQADVYVLPSLSEQSGSLSLIEAMQAALPCIASDCDGISEDITDEADGLLVPPGEIDALSRALERLTLDPDLRQRLASGARATFERRFSADAFSADLGAAYAEAIGA